MRNIAFKKNQQEIEDGRASLLLSEFWGLKGKIFTVTACGNCINLQIKFTAED